MNKRFFLLLILPITVILISSTLDLDSLLDYENQIIPSYITKDNTTTNIITDEGVTLGRVLFYDKNLSANNTIACASCHIQEFAFGDTAVASIGLNGGTTGRHSMRLINARFSDEARFFWDERANTLEDQTTMPIQDHVEMGFSDTNGDPDIDSLIRKLETLEYYNQLFQFVYGDTIITESRLQECLAQFVRSIQSFDSKFDQGRSNVNGNGVPFSNYTNDENSGKQLFLLAPQFDNQGNRVGGGLGCQVCHQAPEFSINPTSRNNGVISSLTLSIDVDNTRSPTLRDLFDQNGNLNGPMMHDGSFMTIDQVLDHYDSIPNQAGNNNLSPLLRPQGNLQRLHMTTLERSQLIDFLKTLSGNDVYTNAKWSNPFTNDSLIVLGGNTSISLTDYTYDRVKVYPNPFIESIYVEWEENSQSQVDLYDINGKWLKSIPANTHVNLSDLGRGIYLLRIGKASQRIVKL
ncbi:MAG: T9SS type A sorting domain-containing protein [Flavobacteriales bacterium]|nr:T9SS type A sorting domain-containing protein [Flavobacteriales bacterium]